LPNKATGKNNKKGFEISKLCQFVSILTMLNDKIRKKEQKEERNTNPIMKRDDASLFELALGNDQSNRHAEKADKIPRYEENIAKTPKSFGV